MQSLPQRDPSKSNSEQGLYTKFRVARIDGRDVAGGDRHGARYFVLDLDHDEHALPAIRAYIESCEDEYPSLAGDLRAQVDRIIPGNFVTVPETALPDGSIVPSFQVSQYLCSRHKDGRPCVGINYHESRTACEQAGLNLLTERQALAIAHDIAGQDINWTGGKVGEGSLYQGIRKGNVSEAQGPGYESDDPDERCWHELSNGERIYHFAGNAFSWIFDDVQGNESGIVAKDFAPDSPSLQAPYPSLEKGMGWRPPAGADGSGYALVRGGHWGSESTAGVFYLSGGWPDLEYDNVGFRCTK